MNKVWITPNYPAQLFVPTDTNTSNLQQGHVLLAPETVFKIWCVYFDSCVLWLSAKVLLC